MGGWGLCIHFNCHYDNKFSSHKCYSLLSEFLVIFHNFCRCGDTHSTGVRRHINAEVVTYWRLLLCFEIVGQHHNKTLILMLKYWFNNQHKLFMIHNPVVMFSYSDGTFYLWETNTWTSEQWSSTSGFVKVYEVQFMFYWSF